LTSKFLQHVGLKVISLGSDALFQSPLPLFHALLERFLRDCSELSHHGCFNGLLRALLSQQNHPSGYYCISEEDRSWTNDLGHAGYIWCQSFWKSLL